MTKVDQFESAFRSASKTLFRLTPVEIHTVLVVTDLEDYPARQLGDQVRGFLGVLEADGHVTWRVLNGEEFTSVPQLLQAIESERPDLICAYRHLHKTDWHIPFALGDYVETLTQATTTPVLVIPHPDSSRISDHVMKNTNRVMAMTNHLTGEHRLVNHAMRFTEAGGTLFLAHVEDDATYRRYLDTIARIPSLDTDIAREEILQQLLKEPADYIESCRTVLAEHGTAITVESIVTCGHRLGEFRRLIDEHEIDLLVFNTRDEDQMAMHGLAYPLAVELRHIPLLML